LFASQNDVTTRWDTGAGIGLFQQMMHRESKKAMRKQAGTISFLISIRSVTGLHKHSQSDAINYAISYGTYGQFVLLVGSLSR
jgi:hypothetical protein